MKLLTYSSFIKCQVFTPLVEKCKKYGRAMRIGTNHGSLSDRIMSYYGDSPRGMVSSSSTSYTASATHLLCIYVCPSKNCPSYKAMIGQVESAFEFARICRKLDYHNFVFSMKASNPVIMVQAYRLLVAEMLLKLEKVRMGGWSLQLALELFFRYACDWFHIKWNLFKLP